MLQFFKKRPLAWLYVGGGVALAAAVGVWCYNASFNAERVFWNTIERGLATRSVTIQADQAAEGSTAKETVRYSLGVDNLAHSFTTLTQGGTTVQTEMIGTASATYSRFLDVKTDQTKTDGTPIDFSKLVGIWSEVDGVGGQFFAQTLLGVSLPVGGTGVPIGELPAQKRATLMKQIRDDHVYQVAFDKVKKERVNGRMHYTYDVSLQPVAYMALMKHFAQGLGLHDLDQLDPKAYEGQPSLSLQMTIDVNAQQIVRVSDPNRGGSQTYSGYGIPVQVTPPQNAISGAELQQMLSQLQ